MTTNLILSSVVFSFSSPHCLLVFLSAVTEAPKRLFSAAPARRWVIKSLLEPGLSISAPPNLDDLENERRTVIQSESDNAADSTSDIRNTPPRADNVQQDYLTVPVPSPSFTVNVNQRSVNDTVMTDVKRFAQEDQPANLYYEEDADGEERLQVMELNEEEIACVGVQFPPWFVSTHGLSRPSTPEERDVTR